jgi:hypothetical protein
VPSVFVASDFIRDDRCEMAIAGFQRNVAYETLTSRA